MTNATRQLDTPDLEARVKSMYEQTHLYLSSLNSDPVLTRATLRALVARVTGVAPNSTAAGTAIAAHLEDSADGFSPQDLTVMRTFAGC